ncbi:hypothetical protein DEM27_10300 [Metarhizobium album]|uniref:Uncharacterized protein n=1 Tax=Metarhizobium album TaxID=2182425 RepID=A0A2U2DTV5_9HYPH|nr:hypothetical protein DEM27_10300 [Rhizobium album]
MSKSASYLMLLFALSLAVSGCSTSANDGSGFETLTPSAGTRQFIIANDRGFANQVASHNRTCQKQAGCRK